MPNISATLDFALGMACLGFALASIRLRNDFLFTGYLWVAAAAVVGAFNLGGFTQVDPTHHWLSQVSRGPGMLAMALGVVAAMVGPMPGARWLSAALAILGATTVHLLSVSPELDLVNLVLGSTLLLALFVLSLSAIRRHQLNLAVTALAALALLLFVGFGLSKVPMPPDGPFRRVDLLHVLLIASYWLIWRSASGASAEFARANLSDTRD